VGVRPLIPEQPAQDEENDRQNGYGHFASPKNLCQIYAMKSVDKSMGKKLRRAGFQ
jgi:hypothetical protein